MNKSNNQKPNSLRSFFSVLRGKTSISDITKVVSYNDINGNSKQEIPILNSDISHIYMGKMNEEEFGIYSDDFLKGILQYYFYCTPKGEKISLELANCVSEVLGENMDGFMNFAKQKNYIQVFVEKNFGKKDSKRLEIIDLETRHPELFTELRKYEKKIRSEANNLGLSAGELDQTPSFDKFNFLESNNIPQLPEKESNFSSLDTAKYLYRVCKNNPAFFDKIKSIKPEKAKSEFYPIIEISIRLTDFLKGVSIQGGAIKQKHYDAIIRDIINPYMNISQYPQLAPLREFCQQIIGDTKFETIYMDGNSKKYRTFTEKIQSEKKQTDSRRIIIGSTSLMLIAALTLYGGMKIHQKNKIERQVQETIKEIFENRKVIRSSDMGGGEYLGDEKIEVINQYVQEIYDRFVFRYGGIGNYSENNFKSKIIDCLNDQQVLNLLGQYRGGNGMVKEDRVIDEYLIPRNIGEFRISGINTTPYFGYLKYTDAFINTILLEEDMQTDRDASVKMDGVRGHKFNHSIVDNIGPYSAKEQGHFASTLYIYQLAQVRIGGKHYLFATGRSHYDNFKKSENYKLYTSNGRNLAIDFLKQTYPIVNELMDQYLLRYYRRNSNSGDLNGYYKEKLSGNIELLILRDFLSKGLLKKLQKTQTEKIVSYLDEFVIQNQDTLKELGYEINPNSIPNGFLQKYEEAMQNTIKDKDKLFLWHSWLPVSRRIPDDKEMVVKQLGRYRASDGKIYLVGKVKIDGKEYLYAEEEGRIYRDQNQYGIYCGEIVAKDYFQTKSDFLQKKILYEKKLKSASQRHIDVNEKSRQDTLKNYKKK